MNIANIDRAKVLIDKRDRYKRYREFVFNRRFEILFGIDSSVIDNVSDKSDIRDMLLAFYRTEIDKIDKELEQL